MFDKTIENLTEKLTPVTPLRHPALRVLPYMILSFAYISIVIAFLGVRHDFEFKMEETSYLFELVMSFIAGITACVCAAYASVPDMRQKPWLFYIPVLFGGVLLLWLGIRMATEELGHTHIHTSHCIRDGILLCVIPTAFLVFMIRQGATTYPYRSVSLAVLASTFMGWMGLRIICSLDQLAHVMITHVFPFVVIGAILGMSAQRLLKW